MGARWRLRVGATARGYGDEAAEAGPSDPRHTSDGAQSKSPPTRCGGLELTVDASLRVGLVGCGSWGVNVLRDLQALGCEVTVVARSAETRQRATVGGARSVVNDIAALGSVDGVIVATSTPTHAD